MWVKVPSIVKRLLKGVIWDLPADNKKIYITFDDGPEPEVTPRVLVFLSRFGAKATFFCLGEKIEQNPSLFKALKEEGHCIGNHGYKHLSGFRTRNKNYIANAKLGAEISGNHLFRPPYGRITLTQYNALKQEQTIVMWSIMSLDFSAKMTPQQCVNNVLSNVYPGAIIVFHDSQKGSSNLLVALPEILRQLSEQGYTFGVLC
jgi:peptidoglycan/xylan/chitin deacetylase (PgdA/CDA1 family)